jgi:hypothetical protein
MATSGERSAVAQYFMCFNYSLLSSRQMAVHRLIASSAVCLCRGAFRMSRVERLYVESAGPVLNHSLKNLALRLCHRAEHCQEFPFPWSSTPAGFPGQLCT